MTSARQSAVRVKLPCVHRGPREKIGGPCGHSVYPCGHHGDLCTSVKPCKETGRVCAVCPDYVAPLALERSEPATAPATVSADAIPVRRIAPRPKSAPVRVELPKPVVLPVAAFTVATPAASVVLPGVQAVSAGRRVGTFVTYRPNRAKPMTVTTA